VAFLSESSGIAVTGTQAGTKHVVQVNLKELPDELVSEGRYDTEVV
jgi:hypothetical protein